MHGQGAPMGGAEKARIVVLLLVVCFFASVASHYWEAFYERCGYPRGTPFFRPDDFPFVGLGASPGLEYDPPTAVHLFGDFFAPVMQTRFGAPWSGEPVYPSNYLPFAHLVLLPFTWAPYALALMLYLALFSAGLMLFVHRHLRQGDDTAGSLTTAFAVTFLSYPTLLVLDRGNIEGLQFLFLAGAALLFRARPMAAALLVGAAAAMKGYPGVALLLFLGDRRYREFAAGVLCAVALTLVAAASFDGGLVHSLHAVLLSLRRYSEVSLSSVDGLVQNVSPLAALLAALPVPAESFPRVQSLYSAFAAVVLALAVAALAVPACAARLETWQRWTLAVLVPVVAMPVSVAYKLLHLAVPLALFLSGPSPRREALAWSVMFGLVLALKDFGLARGYASTDVLVVPPVLLLMTGALLVRALKPAPRTEPAAVADVSA